MTWNRESTRAPVAAAFLAVAVVSCSYNTKWPRTDEVLGRLQCGMTEEQVAAIVLQYRMLYYDAEVGVPGATVAFKKSTHIVLDFDESGLFQAEVAWRNGWMSFDSYPHAFCDVAGAPPRAPD